MQQDISNIETLFIIIECTKKLVSFVAIKVSAEVKSIAYVALDVESEYNYIDGRHEWRLPNGKLHRFSGAAVRSRYGNEYFINGREYTFETFWKYMKHTKYAKRIMADILGSRNEW